MEDEAPENVQVACKMCLKSKAKYTCPRCNVAYCSLECYQSEKHAGCSEAFYKECVVSELSGMTNDPEDKQKVLDMLARDLEDRAEEHPEENSDDDLADRLEGLDLDKDISTVWSRLKPSEKEDFARMLQDGRLARLIEIWTPWWLRRENQKLVMEDVACKDDGSRVPEIMSNITDINTLLRNKRPSAECKFDLLNALFSYAFVARLHNGCHMECPMDSTQDILDTCFILRDQNRCGSVGEAIQKALDDVCKKSQKTQEFGGNMNSTILEDLVKLISGPGKIHSLVFISAALSDLISLFQTALGVIKKELKDRRRSGEDESDLSKLKAAVFKGEKKLAFLLSWSQRYGMGAHQLLPQLQFEIETRRTEVEQVDEIKAAVESHMDKLKPKDDQDTEISHEPPGQKPLIEELN